MIKSVDVGIRGISPMLMHRFPMEPIEALEKKSAEEQAEIAAYRDPDTGDLYVPGMALQRAMIAAAAFSKGKGRSTLQKPLAACLFVDPERVSLGVKEFIVDSRPVVVPATKGRIIRHRPRLNVWECAFSMQFDPDMLTEQQVRRVLDDCGSKVGIMDFRPACKGPFGRFMVTNWK